MSEQIVMLKLPTKWDISSDEEEKRAEILGILNEENENIVDGFIFVNIKEIAAINESSNENECVVRINGTSHRVIMSVASLAKLLKANGVVFKTVNNVVI